MMNNFFSGILLLFLGFGVAQPVQAPQMPETTVIESPEVEITPPTVPVVRPRILTDKGDALVQKSLLAPLRESKKVELEKDMFSRCGSGFSYMDDSDAVADAYYHGVIWYYIGCGDGTEIVKFRVNREETVLEVWDAATRKFVAPGVWLQSYLASQN